MHQHNVRELPVSSLESIRFLDLKLSVLSLIKRAKEGSLKPYGVGESNTNQDWANNNGSLMPHPSIRIAESALLRIPLPRVFLVAYRGNTYVENGISILRNLVLYVDPEIVGQKRDSIPFKNLCKLMEYSHGYSDWTSLSPGLQNRIMETQIPITQISISDDFLDDSMNLEVLRNLISRIQGNWT